MSLAEPWELTLLLTEQEQPEPASLTIRHDQRNLELSGHHSGVREGNTQRRAKARQCLGLNQSEVDLGGGSGFQVCF